MLTRLPQQRSDEAVAGIAGFTPTRWIWPERHATLKPVLVGLESLRSIKLACQRLKLSDAQVEDIFCTNAMQLYK